MNALDRNKDLKCKESRGGRGGLKGAFASRSHEFPNKFKKNNKDISGKDLRPQLSNIITICTESLTFLVMENLDRESIRRQYLSKILPCKAGPS